MGVTYLPRLLQATHRELLLRAVDAAVSTRVSAALQTLPATAYVHAAQQLACGAATRLVLAKQQVIPRACT